MEDAAAITSLPNDPQALQRMLLERDRHIATLTQELDAAARQRDELTIAKLRLEVELLRLRKWYYGRKADALSTTADVTQMLLSFGQELEQRPVEAQDVPQDAKPLEPSALRRVRRGRRNLAAFDQLPVIRQEHDLPDDEKSCPCCGHVRQRIGSETSWQLEYVPGHFERIEHVRHKYACKHCDQNGDGGNIALADKATQPIDKGLAGPGLLAYVVTSSSAITCRCTAWSRSSRETASRSTGPR